MINKAILEGRLSQAVELRMTPQGRAVANFRLATERQWNGADGTPMRATDWHTVVAWEGLAEQCKNLRPEQIAGMSAEEKRMMLEDMGATRSSSSRATCSTT